MLRQETRINYGRFPERREVNGKTEKEFRTRIGVRCGEAWKVYMCGHAKQKIVTMWSVKEGMNVVNA